MENLFRGVAMYSGVVVVGRLAGLLGLLLYVLLGMAALAPIVFSVTVLLLDLNLNPRCYNHIILSAYKIRAPMKKK